MTQQKQTILPADKALMIVDSSAIKLLAQPVMREHLTVEVEDPHLTPRYMDLIKPLAQYGGFEVHVPAMVAFEAGRMLNPDYLKEALFGNNPRYSTSRTRALDNAHANSEACLNAMSGYPNIHFTFPNTNDQSPPALFVRRLKRALEMKDKAQARHEVVALTSADTDQYGDLAITKMVEALPPQDKRPVICLSNDGKLCTKLRAARPDLTIVSLSSKSLLQAMQHTGLEKLASIRLPHTDNPRQINDLVDQLDRNDVALWSVVATKVPRRMYGSSFTDSSHNAGEQQDGYFLELLQKQRHQILNAAELDKELSKPKVTKQDEEKADSALAKLQQARINRFARRPPSDPSQSTGFSK